MAQVLTDAEMTRVLAPNRLEPRDDIPDPIFDFDGVHAAIDAIPNPDPRWKSHARFVKWGARRDDVWVHHGCPPSDDTSTWVIVIGADGWNALVNEHGTAG
jgi:hypothetical protein